VTLGAGLLEKAGRAAESAGVLLDHGDLDGACSRAYYAIFDAARFALACRGHEPETIRTHSSVHSAFAKEFVKPGAVTKEIGRLLGQVQDLRLLADYAAEPVLPDKARWAVEMAKLFVETIASLGLARA